MIKAVYSFWCAAIVVSMVSAANAQLPPTETAVNEAVRRQADTIVLRQRLIEARQAVAEKDLAVAAKLYEDAYSLVRRIGTGVEAEAAETVEGLTSVRVDLARAAQKRSNYKEADVQLSRALRVSPGNPEVEAMKQHNDKLLAEQAGRIPSDETLDQVPAIIKEKQDAGTLVQDGKLLYELGKLPEAESKLNQALEIDPQNGPANYYLDLVRDAKYRGHSRSRESYSRDAQVLVEQAWEMPVQRDTLPVPNPYAHSTDIHTGKGRQTIVSKLDRIRMDTVFYDGLPLGEVVRLLSEESRKRDPDKRGINFLVNPNEVAPAAFIPTQTQFDPITGLPISAPPIDDEPTDIAGVLIKINPPLTDLRLADVLDAVVTVAEQPIRYSIEDYAIVFSLRGPEPEPLYTRTYKVDPNTFWQGLESVGGFSFGDIEVGSQGGGGGRGGGGRSSSRGGGGGDQSDTISIPRVNVGGAVSGGRGGNQSGNQSGVGLKFLTKTNTVEEMQTAVRQFFITMGVDLIPPKTVFFNDRSGVLWARATLQELDIIETAIQVLNVSPPQVNIKAKFADIGQRDQKAIGFDWFLGNLLMGNGNVVGSAGTAPSLAGQPSQANPLGFFPGTSAENTIPSSPADQLLTSGLGNPLNAPALATFTGILTDPQFRVVIKALDQREGVDLLSAPEVTTVSGRQAQIQVIDIQSIVTGIDLNQNTGGGGNNLNTGVGNGGSGVVGSTLNYNVQALPFGPVLDVVPYVSADGYSVQMVIIPTVTEFIGYDDPGQFVPQAQSVSGGAGGVGIPITGQLPLPRFRLRQVTTSAVVWDGQTVVLGGLISESVQKSKDKVPLLGDLPLFGRLFRSESSDTQKRNLVIFVTPTIIDPAGNRYHSEDEMPFAQTTIPEQIPTASVGAP